MEEKEKKSNDGDAWNRGYFLLDKFKDKPQTVYHFLLKVEKKYSAHKINTSTWLTSFNQPTT